MKKIKLAFFDAKPYDIESFEKTNQKFGFKIQYFNEHLKNESAIMTKGFDAVCIFVNDNVSKNIADILLNNNIKLIALRCSGYNNVDLKAIFKKIHAVRVPAYSPNAVAEHALALMLTLNRKTHKAYSRTRDSNFNINGLLGFDMNNKTAGIIGTGKIGKILIKILKGLGMKVLAYDLYPDNNYAKELGFTYTDLDTLYKEADVISLHCPLNKDTFHLINKTSINKMKKNVMIINTGRGQLINTKDLIEGLKSHKIGYAGLDVYEEESEYFFEDFSNFVLGDDVLARLLTFPNVLITSHQGFFTKEALNNIAHTTLQNIKSYFKTGTLENEVCYQCGESPASCKKTKTGKCF